MAAKDIRADAGQVCWIGFEGTQLDDATRRVFAEGDAGAAILFGRNIPTAGDEADLEALAELLDEIHASAPGRPAVWIAVDQEGGRVQRVKAPATVWPPMLHLGQAEEALAESVGLAMGQELAAMGFDVDFAPVLDVHTNSANPIIGDRAFATDATRAADCALAFARGLAGAGIVACGKHFPGHGDTHLDSHLALPRIDHDMDRLRSVELAPFARAAAAGIPMLMTAHVIFAALDAKRPATLSPRVITELLRGELGYRGLIVSDDLDMKAVADHFGIAEAATMAVSAGCDIILLCRNPDHQRQAREGLIGAAESDTVFRAALGRAADRIRAAKASHTSGSRDRSVIGCSAHRALADRLRTFVLPSAPHPK